MLHWMQFAALSAAAAGGAAALADVAAARRPHFRAAGQAERRVGAAPQLRLNEFHRAVRLRWAVSTGDPFGSVPFCLTMSVLHWHGLSHLHRIRLLGRRRGILAG